MNGTNDMKIKPVFRSDGKILRLVRIIWERGGVGDGKGYSAHLSLALHKRLWNASREGIHRIEVTILGLRVSYNRAYGGHFS